MNFGSPDHLGNNSVSFSLMVTSHIPNAYQLYVLANSTQWKPFISSKV